MRFNFTFLTMLNHIKLVCLVSASDTDGDSDNEEKGTQL